MVLVKHAFVNMPIERENVVSREEVFADSAISNRFADTVSSLKKMAVNDDNYIAPVKSDDFLYFRAIMMHAAERCNIDTKTGEVIGDASFTLEKNANGDDVWKWNGGKENRQPYSNQNGDIFPESELKKSYDKFVGRGLFVNHASDDAEKIRGIIIDAVYDDKFKKVEGLIALDKKAYPELARQIESGYQTGVSMGTQVQASFCTICGNKAIVEADFCACIRDQKTKLVNGMFCGEVNVGLNPIELSVVSVPADPEARIRQVYAMLQKVANNVEKSSNESLKQDYKHMLNQNCFNETINNNVGIEELKKVIASLIRDDKIDGNTEIGEVKTVLSGLKNQIEKIERSVHKIARKKSGGLQMTEVRDRAANRRKMVAYLQGTEEPTTYPVDPLQDQLRVRDDRQMHADVPAGGYSDDAAVKSRLQRAENRSALRDKVIAYVQGTEEPHPPQQYSPDPTNEKVRDNEDRQMQAKDIPDNVDIPLKQKLQRANLRDVHARFTYAYLPNGEVDKPNSRWVVASGDDVLFEATAEEIYGTDLDSVAQTVDNVEDPARRTYWEFLASKAYGEELMRVINAEGIENAAMMLKGADAFSDQMGSPGPGEGEGDVNINIDADGVGEDGFGEEAEELSSGAEDALQQIAQILEDQGVCQLLGGEESGELGELEGAEQELNEVEQGLQNDKLASNKQFLKIAREAIGDANIIINAVLSKVANTSCEVSGEVNNPKTNDPDASEKDGEMADTAQGEPHSAPTDETATNAMVTAKQRKAARQRLAELATEQRSPLLHDSSSLGQLNHSGSSDRGADTTVEGLAEAQDADLAAARSTPTGKQGSDKSKVKTASEELVEAVNEERAVEGTKEYEAKFVAAWDLAVEMRRKNLIPSDDQILTQAKKIVAMDQEAFDNMKSIVANITVSNKMEKSASINEAATIPPFGSVESSLRDSQSKTTEPTITEKLSRLNWS